jgi:signal transduction histidine kinase
MEPERSAIRVLVVDDSVGDFDLVAELLDVADEGGWTLEHAQTWEDGLRALARGAHDAALVDFRLGGRDGLELVEAVLAEGCRTPLVLLTGAGRQGLDRAALSAGAADYLDKNALDPELLATTIRRAIARQAFLESTRPATLRLEDGDRDLRLASRLVDGLLVCSPQGTVLHATPEAEVLFGRSLRELREVELGPLGAGTRTEFEIPDVGQRRRVVSIRSAEVLWAGQPAFVVGLVDRSGQALAEARLGAAEKMATVGRFAGGIAHDFNNLLQAVVGHLDLCREERCPEPSCGGHMEEATVAADRAARVVQRLLAFAARRQVRAEPVDPSVRIAAMEPLLAEAVGVETRLEVVTEGRGSIVSIDPGELEQVVLNLVSNAAAAAGPDGTVVVRVGRRRLASVLEESPAPLPPPAPGVYATIDVEDDGDGIRPDQLNLIFEPFYSVRGLGTSTGLGLAIVEEIVRERDGFISVRTAPGQGTRVRIGLPLASGVPQPESGSYDLPLERSSSPGRILLVDDERAVLSALASALRTAGHDTLVADCGASALGQIQELDRPLDLLVTDIVMPGMDGFELADQVRRAQPELPVLFITGHGRDVLASRDLDGTQVEILQKPFRMGELLSRVGRLMEAARGDVPGGERD